jgi:hypothetical protein
MNMKTKNMIVIGLVIVITKLFNACSLDENNLSGGPTIEDKALSAADFEQLINGCYFPLTRTWTGGGEDRVIYMAECGTDLWTCPQGTDYMKQIFYYMDLNGAFSGVDEGWQCSYESINMCNVAIHYASTSNFKTDEERNAKVAEAHFLRAFFNFFIVEQFGGKYLPTQETTIPITNIPLSSVDNFYQLIFSDLEFAQQYLPKIQAERGRATKGAAYHLYAKACLQYAGYESIPNKQELYTKAKSAATELIENKASYGLDLYSNASDVFLPENNKNNREAIWVATHSKNPSLNPRGKNYWNRVYKQFGCLQNDGTCGVKWDINSEYVKFENRIMPTLALLDLYSSNDTRYEAYFREKYIANTDYIWSDGDCSKYQKDDMTFAGKKTISQGSLGMFFTRQDIPDPLSLNYACFDRDMLFNPDGTSVKGIVQYGHPVLKKFEAPGMYAGELGKSYTWADHLIYRLAETYLLAGEACFRLGGSELDEAVKYFNEVRNRACNNHDKSMNISVFDINVDFILAERARELCGEYTRWMDLKRMGKTVMERYVNSNPDIKAGGKFDVNIHYVRPVPDNKELNYQSNPKDFQNPEY